jgi:hypothetical protein
MSAAVPPIHLRATDAIFRFAAGFGHRLLRHTPGLATDGALQQDLIAHLSPVLFPPAQSKSLAHGVSPLHTAFWPQNPLPVPFRVDVKQKQVELPLQFVMFPQVWPRHWALLQIPFSQTPERQTLPQNPQFSGSVEVLAVQLGLVEIVGDADEVVENLE